MMAQILEDWLAVIVKASRLGIAALVVAGCTTAPAPQPEVPVFPSGTTFAEWVASGQVNPETFDFSASGYWRLTELERIEWRQPTLDASMRTFTGAVDSCTPVAQRQAASMVWMMLLTQAGTESEWADNARALRARLAQLDAELAAIRAQTTSIDPRVAELLERFARDQAVRKVAMQSRWTQGLPSIAANNWGLASISRFAAIDCANTAWLKTQLAAIGWFAIPTYGAEADNAAWHLVQHADREPDFQRRMLKELEALPKGHTDPKRIGYLWDRVARADKRLQRYGTQGTCTDGQWKAFEVEDPEHLDERRKSLGMEPIAEHEKLVSREACPK
jgi:hypothetical protein